MKQRPLAIYHIYKITCAVAQHPYAVGAFFGIQSADSGICVVGIKQFHMCKVSKFFSNFVTL